MHLRKKLILLEMYFLFNRHQEEKLFFYSKVLHCGFFIKKPLLKQTLQYYMNLIFENKACGQPSSTQSVIAGGPVALLWPVI